MEENHNGKPAIRNAAVILEKIVKSNVHFNNITPARFRAHIMISDRTAQLQQALETLDYKAMKQVMR